MRTFKPFLFLLLILLSIYGFTLDSTNSNLGSGTITSGYEGSVTWNPSNISSNQTVSTTLTVTGAALGDYVLVSSSIQLSVQLTLTARVDAANTVIIVLNNDNTGAVDPASATYYVTVLKK